MEMSKKKEMRTVDITNLSTRDGVGNQSVVIEGYAAVFNSPTMIGEYFEEVIMPGAFAKAITSNNDVRALFNHDWNHVLGRTKSGTLRLYEDERGLKFEVDLPNSSFAKDLAESLNRGDISQCSFGFFPTGETWDYSVEPVKRTLHDLELYEVSVVSIPAYEDTEVALVRSKEQIDKSVETRIKLIKQIEGVWKND
jgi:uncharacterized protein